MSLKNLRVAKVKVRTKEGGKIIFKYLEKERKIKSKPPDLDTTELDGGVKV